MKRIGDVVLRGSGWSFLSILLMVMATAFAWRPMGAFAASVVDGFNPNANALVLSIAIQSDGKILVGGYFTSIGGQTRNHIARLNPDGTLDTTFVDPNANDLVSAIASIASIAIQSDGKILVGGSFRFIFGQSRDRIARLNPDGTLDTTFVDLKADNSVLSIAIQSDGKILVGGYFTSIGGQTRNCIARLNPDGTLDTTFNPKFVKNILPSVYSIAVQSDGKILVGGHFTIIGGQTRNHIARLNPDGTLDTTFVDPNLKANDSVDSIAVQTDGKILVGGGFTSIGGQTRNYIARLNPDGTLDTTFNPKFVKNYSHHVDSIAVQTDGKILVGGHFPIIGGQTRNHIARLNPDGTLDTTFVDLNANADVSSIAVQTDGKILVGGDFTSIGGQTRNHIARLNPNGTNANKKDRLHF
jgi:uncharacterized delta-60 repeat protein